MARAVAEVRAALVGRGITLRRGRDGRLEVHPAHLLTPEDRAALTTHRDALLALVVAEPAAAGAASPPPEPSTPCELCGTTAWQWAPDWPEPGRGAWCCGTCMARPNPTLPELYQSLTPDERQRLATEAAAGDRLALHVLGELLVVRCSRCGGARWQPAPDGDLERCVACGAPAPFSTPAAAEGP
jgi:hypothetical protein